MSPVQQLTTLKHKRAHSYLPNSVLSSVIYFLYIYLFAFQIFPSFHVLDRVNYSNPPFSVLLTIDFILRRRKALLPNGFITDFQQAKLFDLYTTLLSPTTNHNFACMYNDLLGTFKGLYLYTHSMRIRIFLYAVG